MRLTDKQVNAVFHAMSVQSDAYNRYQDVTKGTEVVLKQIKVDAELKEGLSILARFPNLGNSWLLGFEAMRKAVNHHLEG